MMDVITYPCWDYDINTTKESMKNRAHILGDILWSPAIIAEAIILAPSHVIKFLQLI